VSTPDSQASQSSGIRSIINLKPRSQEEIAEQQAKDSVALAKARQELHAVYYQGLTNPPKPKEEPVAQRLEREERQEEQNELQAQKRKPTQLPPNTKPGTAERVSTSG